VIYKFTVGDKGKQTKMTGRWEEVNKKDRRVIEMKYSAPVKTGVDLSEEKDTRIWMQKIPPNTCLHVEVANFYTGKF